MSRNMKFCMWIDYELCRKYCFKFRRDEVLSLCMTDNFNKKQNQRRHTNNKTSNVRINVTLRRVRVNFVGYSLQRLSEHFSF